MFVEKLNISIVYPFRNLLSYLMRTPSLNHVQFRPSIFCFRAGRGAHEKGVFQLTLQRVLLDVICEHGRDLSIGTLKLVAEACVTKGEKAGIEKTV